MSARLLLPVVRCQQPPDVGKRLPKKTIILGMSDLAKRIRDARREAGLSQTALGELAGMRQQMISKLENGNARYTSRFEQLAHALGVNQAWLITGQGPSDPGAQPPLDDLSVLSALLSDDQRQMFAGWMRDLLQIASDA